MKRITIISFIVLLGTINLFAQTNDVKYRRGSLAMILIGSENFPNKEAVMKSWNNYPFPEKYNIHSVGVKTMNPAKFEVTEDDKKAFDGPQSKAGAVLSKEYRFTIPSRGAKYYEFKVPEGATRIKAVISEQTQMVNLALYPPGKEVPVSKSTTWSNLSNWKRPIECSKSKPKAGIWRIKVEGSVHVGKLDKIKSVSGVLTITVDGAS